ncbi:hypothetical protein [Burkholderia ambifaria]
MSNSTTLLDTIAVNQSNKEAVANALFDAASPGMLWGRHASACSGLTWGYYGGTYMVGATANAIADGTVTLTASTTNYLYADNATGAVSVNTTGVPAGQIPLYTIVTGTATVSSYTDKRSYQPSAIAGVGSVTSVGVSMPGIYSVAGSPITSSGTITVTLNTQSANTVFAGPSSGAAAAPTFRALVGGDIPIFGASGSSHAPGGVPDPGSTAGSTKYLCENGTWAVPAGGGGGGGGTVTDVAATQGVETAAGSDITTTGTIRANLVPTIYTAAHTVVTGDRGAGIVMNSASAVAQALPTAGGTNFPSGWYCDFANIGAGVMTLSVPSGAYLDGVLNGTLALSQSTGVTVFTDGSNWFSLRGAAPATSAPKDALGYYLANNPSASSFTLMTQTGATSTMASLASGRGFYIKVPATNSADNNTFAYQTPPGGSTWTMTAMLGASTLKGNATNFGLAVQDTNPNTQTFVFSGFSAAVTSENWFGGVNNFSGRTSGISIGTLPVSSHLWMRLQYTSGGNFIFSLSPDGETFVEVYRVGVTSWLTVAPTKAGIWLNTNDNAANSNIQNVLSCMHFAIA